MSDSDETSVCIFFNLGFLCIGKRETADLFHFTDIITLLNIKIFRYLIRLYGFSTYVHYSFLFQVETTDKLKQIFP